MAEVVSISNSPRYIAAKKRLSKRNSRKAMLQRFETLKSERVSWMSHWREVAELTLPRRMKMFYDSRQRGEKMNQKIINSTPGRALRILSSGMMSGISSPARPWFRLITPNPDLAKAENVRLWLHDVEERMRTVFSRSNIYDTLALCYRDLGNFGTAVMVVEEDEETTIRGYSCTPGTYVLQQSSRCVVDTVYHETSMTVGQIAERFGLDNASTGLIALWEQDKIDFPVRVIHVIQPNEAYVAGQMGRSGKKYRSVWLEGDSAKGDPVDGPPLWEGTGYNEFPAMCPRWDVNSDEIYGASPAMEALGDMKALQQLEKRKLSIYDKISNPPMTAPVSLENQKRSQLAGDVTFLNTQPGSQKFEPAYQIDPRAMMISSEIQVHEKRILQSFYADLFLMLSNMDQAQPITAREVDERHEEKMLQLGPVLERLHGELLMLLISRTFEIMVRAGLIPPAPMELQGMDLRVEFISILAQAQKLLGTAAVERLVSFIGGVVGVFPEASDKLDIDETVDDYASMLGTNPGLIRTGDELAKLRASRAQQQQMMALAQSAKPASDAANAAATIAGIDSGQPGTLNNLISALQPNGPLPRPA